ncbi:MAG: glutathione S-transferase family protein [Gammaproteobacteria bacterium]|nr:glutathione S-transferase family protein [Gammaproteobacteria bacterium]
MLELVTFPAAFGMRNVSPFCLKAEMLLTSLDEPFTLREEADPRKAPKGKLPYLIIDDECLADSELIVEYLDMTTQGRVYAGLSARDKGIGVALTRLAEDHLYWMMVASRWLDDGWWPNVVEGFFGAVPKLIRPVIASGARKQVRRTYHLHGLGRHTAEEQAGFAKRDLEALNGAVDGKTFLFGDTPNVFDFAISAMMAGIYDNQPGTWLTELAQPHEGLHAYTRRVQDHVGVYGRSPG